MKLEAIIGFDPQIKIVKNNGWPEEILAISSLDHLTSHGLIFIKNGKFLKKFEESIPKAAELKVGAIIDEKFYSMISEEDKAALDKLPWIGTTPSVPLSLTILSKPFYDRKMKGLNCQADGRQMGTVDIDPTALISQNVFIGEHVKIGKKVQIMPGVVILPHSVVQDGSIIYPNVTLYPFTTIGKNCRIHSGTVIGSDGYGYTFHQGQHLKIWHMGGVEIHDDVEIGSNTSVDQGTFSPTIIGSGTRIDNQVQIAHNCRIGRGCILCGQAGLAGSVTLEDFVVMGGKAAIGPDAHIGMGSQIAGAAGVNDGAVLPAGSKVGGHPARDIKEWMRGVAYLRKVSQRDTK